MPSEWEYMLGVVRLYPVIWYTHVPDNIEGPWIELNCYARLVRGLRFREFIRDRTRNFEACHEREIPGSVGYDSKLHT